MTTGRINQNAFIGSSWIIDLAWVTFASIPSFPPVAQQRQPVSKDEQSLNMQSCRGRANSPARQPAISKVDSPPRQARSASDRNNARKRILASCYPATIVKTTSLLLLPTDRANTTNPLSFRRTFPSEKYSSPSSPGPLACLAFRCKKNDPQHARGTVRAGRPARANEKESHGTAMDQTFSSSGSLPHAGRTLGRETSAPFTRPARRYNLYRTAADRGG